MFYTPLINDCSIFGILFFQKISGIPVFPTSFRVPKSQQPCVFGVAKNPTVTLRHLREMSATLEMIEPDLQKQATLRESTKSVAAEGSEDEVPFKLAALSQLPWHSKYPKR